MCQTRTIVCLHVDTAGTDTWASMDVSGNVAINIININIYSLIILIPIAKKAMQPNNKLLLIGRNVSAFDVGTKIIQPAQSTTLSTAFKTLNKNKDFYSIRL